MRRTQPNEGFSKRKGGMREHLSSFVARPFERQTFLVSKLFHLHKMGILPVFFIFMTLPLFLLAINPNNPTSGKINKDVRARYPSLVLMRESLMPNPTARPQKNTRHVLDMPKERAKLRNPVMELSSTKLRRRKPILARYKSIFGHSKPMRGSEFTPSNIVHYTGKLAQSRRQTFKWSPSGRTEDYFLIPRH